MSDILYTTVGDAHSFEYEEKRSIFIGYVKCVSTEEDAKNFVSEIKSKHHDARHNCSAYLLRNGVMRYSDDGEPQGTAGIPILEVIKKSGLVDIVVVVTRYFGGILLGAGGLVRAYSAATSGVLNEADKVSYQMCVKFSLTVQYSQYDKITHLLQSNSIRVLDTVYGESIELVGVIPEKLFDIFSMNLIDTFGGKITASKISSTIERI